jgi:rhamnosyltransferase subunit B
LFQESEHLYILRMEWSVVGSSPMAEFILMPFGSAGDTYPFIGMGRKLRGRGHEVTVVTNGHFRKAVRQAQLRYQEHGTDEEFLEVSRNPDIWHPTKGFLAVVGHPRMPQTVLEQHHLLVQHIRRNPDVVIVAGSLAFGSRVAHETHGVRLATVHLSPAVFLSVERPPIMPHLKFTSWLPRAMVRISYWLANALVIHPTMNRNVGKLRKEMFLPKVKRYFTKWIHSPDLVLALFPPWFAEPASDWPPQTRLMGFPLFDTGDDQPLAPEVSSYLQAGEPPLVFTFGSAMQHGTPLFQAAIDASYRLRRRCLLLTRFAHQLPSPLPPHAYHFEYVPLSQILPHAAAVVHHGGIGTTAQALHAGAPQVITPLAHDQFDNAQRVRELGVGEVIASRKLTGRRLAKVLGKVLASASVRAATAQVAQLSRHENGLEQACACLEQLAQWRRRPVRSAAGQEGVP